MSGNKDNRIEQANGANVSKYTYTIEFTTDSSLATFTDSIKDEFGKIFKEYSPEVTNTKLKATMPPKTVWYPDDINLLDYKRQINANDSKDKVILDVVKAESGDIGKYWFKEIWWYLEKGTFNKEGKS